MQARILFHVYFQRAFVFVGGNGDFFCAHRTVGDAGVAGDFDCAFEAVVPDYFHRYLQLAHTTEFMRDLAINGHAKRHALGIDHGQGDARCHARPATRFVVDAAPDDLRSARFAHDFFAADLRLADDLHEACPRGSIGGGFEDERATGRAGGNGQWIALDRIR